MSKISFTRPPKTCIATKRLAISFLSKQGMLQPGHRHMEMSWSVRGTETGSMSVQSVINPEARSYLVLSYAMANDSVHNYQVDLVRVPSNLPGSTASRFYMVCPVSGRRAAILYLRQGTERFAHRQAYPGKRLYYDSQLELKRYRGLAANHQATKAWKQQFLERSYRKTTYAGKETKCFTALEIKRLRGSFLTANAILRLGPY